MTDKELSGVRTRLERYLGDLVEPMGRSKRRHWAQIYVQSLLLDGQRKSVQPMAADRRGRRAGIELVPQPKSMGRGGDPTAAGAAFGR